MTTHEHIISDRDHERIWNEIDSVNKRFDYYQEKIFLLRALNAHIKTIHPEDDSYNATTNHFAAWDKGVLILEPIPTNDPDYSPRCPYRIVNNR